jgi:hypothetical protein
MPTDMLHASREDYPNDRIGQLSLAGLYNYMNKPEKTSIFNMLEIPLSGSRIALPVA